MTNIKDEYLKEVAIKPKSWAESLAHSERLKNLREELEMEESGAKEKATFDPMKGVKFVDQFGNALTATVEPTWVNQTKEGTTELTYQVKDIDGGVHSFTRKITVSRYRIEASGIDDTKIELLK